MRSLFKENTWPAPNFSKEELACSCCGETEMDYNFLKKLQDLRSDYGAPMVITSAYRCDHHPIEIKKKLPGSHNQGKAVDVLVSRSDAYRLLSLALQHGFEGIGIAQKGYNNKRFIHLDYGAEHKSRPNLWSY